MIDALRKILQLSEQILEAAEAQNWQAVETLQQQRELASEQTKLTDVPQDKDTSLQAEDLIRHISQIDEKSLVLIEANRQELIKEKLQSNKRNKMARAYQNQPKY